MATEPATRNQQQSPAEEDREEGHSTDWTSLAAFIAALTFAGILATLMITGRHGGGATTNWLLGAGALVTGSCAAWRRMRGGGSREGYRRICILGRELFSYERGWGALPPLDGAARNARANRWAGSTDVPPEAEPDQGDTQGSS